VLRFKTELHPAPVSYRTGFRHATSGFSSDAVMGSGWSVGSGVCSCVGTAVGTGDGTAVGSDVDVGVGRFVGSAVGICVGVSVACAGSGVGLGVGTCVGADVGIGLGGRSRQLATVRPSGAMAWRNASKLPPRLR